MNRDPITNWTLIDRVTPKLRVARLYIGVPNLSGPGNKRLEGCYPKLVNSREPRWRVPERALENIWPGHELWNLHWPQPPDDQNTLPYLVRYFSHGPRFLPAEYKLSSSNSRQSDAAVVASCSVALPCVVQRRVVAGSHGGRGRRRIRQCLRRRRRVGVLLLRAARHPQERLRHRHTRRLPEARAEVAPGPVGERPRRGRRGQAAVPADPGGVLRFVGQGEEGHVRRRALRSPRRRRPGFLGLYAGDAGDDG